MQDTNKEQDNKINKLEICMAELKKDISFIKDGITDIKKEIKDVKENYVSKTEFKPYQKAMYVVGTSVLLAIVAYGMDKILG